jgi:hypothetical protein
MVLIGCTEGQVCAPVTTLPIAYPTEARCLAQRSDMVSALDGLGYDRVIAECRSQGAAKPASARSKAARPKPIA